MTKLTHIGASGDARMVDVSEKAATERAAIAEGRVVMRPETLALIRSGDAKKGDVLGTARIAGIMAAKRTHELIPLCHPIALTKVTVDLALDEALPGVVVRAEAKTVGPTGVEMEALTAAAVACLTVYDMAKAADRGMRIEARAADRQARRQVGALAGGEPRVSRSPLMPVEEALARVLASVPDPLGEELVPLAEAFGRTLARDVVARRFQPPFANSAMDGYALRAADAAGAQARLTVVGEAAAGRPFAGRLEPGEAARIFTGAPLPEGADSVAMQEIAQRDGDSVIIGAPMAPGDHVRQARLRFCRRRNPSARRPTADRPRRGACRRRRPSDAGGAAQAAGRHPVEPATSSSRRARRAGRRRSSPPTPSPSPASSRRRAASRSISAPRPTIPPRSPTASPKLGAPRPTC